MCGIVGLIGNFRGNDLISMMKTIERRGLDAHGVYLENDEHTVFNDNIDLDSFSDNSSYDVGFGHNLLSITNFYKEDNTLNLQPKRRDNLVLSFNGEIYNYKEVLDFLKSNLYNDEPPKSDSELLIILLDYYYKKDHNLLNAVTRTNMIIDGDYVYSVYDGENLAVARDKVGVKPIYYGQHNELKGYASDRKALWKIWIEDINCLKPGYILYNFEEIPPKYFLYNYESHKNHKYETYKKELDNLITKSIKDRIANIDDIAVIFSGGVDSTLLVYYIYENLEEGQSLSLYSVGNEDSQDLKYSRMLAERLDLPLREAIVNEELVRDCLDDALLAIEEPSMMKLGVGMTMYIACRMIHEDGIKVAISGQGADELFAGYKRYLNTYNEGYVDDDGLIYKRFRAVEHELRHDVSKIHSVNLERDDAAAMANTVELRVPYLSENLVKWTLDIPAKYKISGGDDNVRKNILRDLAIDKGIPEFIAYRNKKAAQYGSGIDKILRKKIFKNQNINKYFNNLKENI